MENSCDFEEIDSVKVGDTVLYKKSNIEDHVRRRD